MIPPEDINFGRLHAYSPIESFAASGIQRENGDWQALTVAIIRQIIREEIEAALDRRKAP